MKLMHWYQLSEIDSVPDGKVVFFGREDKLNDAFWYDYAPARFQTHSNTPGWWDEFGNEVDEECTATHFMILDKPKASRSRKRKANENEE